MNEAPVDNEVLRRIQRPWRAVVPTTVHSDGLARDASYKYF